MKLTRKAMTESVSFFADTYALLGLLDGAHSYKPYLASAIVTSKFHLAELYYALLRDYDAETTQHWLAFYSNFIVTVSLSAIAAAMQFKLLFKGEKLSYADCIGYAVAAELGMKFLTGDEKFRSKENVEFVK